MPGTRLSRSPGRGDQTFPLLKKAGLSKEGAAQGLWDWGDGGSRNVSILPSPRYVVFLVLINHKT